MPRGGEQILGSSWPSSSRPHDALATADHVFAVGGHHISPGAAVHAVTPVVPRVDAIVAHATRDAVGALASADDVVAGPAGQDVVAVAARQRVGTGLADEAVRAVAAEQHRAARTTRGPVVAPEAQQNGGAGAPGQAGVARGAGQGG